MSNGKYAFLQKLGAVLATVLPHISIICTAMILTFMTIDRFNVFIGFMNHWMTDIVLAVWAVSSLSTAFLLIRAQRREFRRNHQNTNE